MGAFLYGIVLQWKLDIRDRGIWVTYYMVPFVFFLFMGGIFTSILPGAQETLIQSMTVFGVTMGGVLGTPASLTQIYGSEIKKAYRVGSVPLWTAAVNNFMSGLIHLFIISMMIFFTAPILFDAVIPSHLFTYFFFLFFLIISSLSIGTVFGLFVKNSSKLPIVTQSVFLPSIMLSGIMFPSNLLPRFLQYLGKLFPATWGFQGMCSQKIEMRLLFPIFVILAVLSCVSIIRLKRIHTD